MPEFVLNTADKVDMHPLAKPGDLNWIGVSLAFTDLDAFTQGYIEALFFTENEPGTTRDERVTTRGTVRKSWEAGAREGQHKDMPGDYGFADLAPDALASIIQDCAKFQADNVALLALAYQRDYDAAQAGRDYWFTRNGHGVGFWDREALSANDDDAAEYERLTDIMVAAGNNHKAWGDANAARGRIKDRSIGERLSKACGRNGVDAYIGDDGKVHLS